MTVALPPTSNVVKGLRKAATPLRTPDLASAPSPVVAKSAGLRYVSDAERGITRRRESGGFVYFVGEKQVDDPETLRRISSLVIPPAWNDVWICMRDDGHIQATGRDARRRKQYRYHPRWREIRDGTKYHRMLAFGEALPRIRATVDADVSLPGLARRKVLATVVRLLDQTLIRIGNDEYARTNGTVGLTTMRNEHVDINGSTLRFTFMGKSGKAHDVGLRDPRLARIVRRCQELPGHDLFQYIDDTGEPQRVDSADVNAYLHEITGDDFTAKDFRTWSGTVLAAMELQSLAAQSETQAKANVSSAMKVVAARLGNTPRICRTSYVHPAIIARYLDGSLARRLRAPTAKSKKSPLTPDERAVLRLLRFEARLPAA